MRGKSSCRGQEKVMEAHEFKIKVKTKIPTLIKGGQEVITDLQKAAE